MTERLYHLFYVVKQCFNLELVDSNIQTTIKYDVKEK